MHPSCASTLVEGGTRSGHPLTCPVGFVLNSTCSVQHKNFGLLGPKQSNLAEFLANPILCCKPVSGINSLQKLSGPTVTSTGVFQVVACVAWLLQDLHGIQES